MSKGYLGMKDEQQSQQKDKFEYLISMRKSRKKPQEGDVFVLQPIEGEFYFGKVIQTNLKSIDSFVNGMTLIYVYQYSSNNKELPGTLENEELLIPPVVVNNRPWTMGYFETIGNVGVSESERNVDFAFWDVLREKYVDFTTKEEMVLKHEPKYRSILGLGSYGVIGKEVHKALC